MHNIVQNISSTGGPASAVTSGCSVLIAAGGTGGHVYPAIAIADALRDARPDIDILFVGTRNHLEWRAVPDAGYDIVPVWISGFQRRFTLKNLLFPLKLVVSLIQSYRIMRHFKPDVVVSCGGYAAGPAGWIAGKSGIPLAIQEQNSFPGVTNRMLGKSASIIFTAFRDAGAWFPKEKTKLTGNPLRKALSGVDKEEARKAFNFDMETPVLLILGGSGGAKTINEAVIRHIEALHEVQGLQIIWQCGRRYYDDIKHRTDTGRYHRLYLTEFLYNMPEAYAAADLAVSRAGALSCSEFALTGTPSILIPSPNVAGDHQSRNAQSMVDEGAALLLPDDQAEEALPGRVAELIQDKQRLQKMRENAVAMARPDAAKEIVNELLTLIKVSS